MRVEVSSLYQASADRIWNKLCDVETLREIARPYAFFRQTDGDADFHECGDYAFRLRLFGVIPLGVHRIHIEKWSWPDRIIYSRENNRFVPVWNHSIELSEINRAFTRYTDVVELDAGWKTPCVWLWAYLFYRHRQRKWRRILEDGEYL